MSELAYEKIRALTDRLARVERLAVATARRHVMRDTPPVREYEAAEMAALAEVEARGVAASREAPTGGRADVSKQASGPAPAPLAEVIERVERYLALRIAPSGDDIRRLLDVARKAQDYADGVPAASYVLTEACK